MKYDIESILEMYEDDYNPRAMVPGPRNMKLAEVPRSEMDNFNTPDLDQGADSILRPGETLEDDFDVEFRRPNAQGGVQQLVRNTVDGSRPGYSGRNKGIGSGSPGVPKTYETVRDQLYTEEIKAKKAKTNKLKFQATPVGERLQWIANNGKNYSDPETFIKAYEKHFKHKIGSKSDSLFNTSGKKFLTQIDNLINTGRDAQDLFTLKKGFNEEELFKASMIQNNPEIKKEFKTLFKDIHKNVSVYSELGPEGIVEKLNKGKLLNDFDFIKSTLIGNREIGGVHSGITRNSLLNAAGVPTEHLTSYQSVRKPLMAISEIIENLKNPSKAKEFGISPTTATKIRGQLENFLEGEKNLRADIKKINTQIGDVKFNNIFGGVNFEHTLAKQFGKDYNYLPRNYLLKGQFTTKAFNMMKKDAFDLPLIRLMKQYEQGKVSGAKVQTFIDDFNAKTNNYADFKFDVDKGKLGYTSDSVTYDLSRYNDPNVARQELIDNIKLTQSDTFQKGMKNTVGSGNQLKLFRSKEAGNILKKLLKELCPRGGSASGGRIGFNTAGAVLGSGANCGRNHMNKLLKNGTGTTEERNLIRQVMKAGFDFAKGTGKVAVNLLNPKEFLKLKNWVGKPAMAFMAAVEGLDVADRWIRQGIPINEALGEKWTKFLMPRSLQEYQVEGMREANALSSPASKRYAKGIEISNDLTRAYDQLEMLEKGETAKFKKTGDAERIANLKKLIRTKEKKYYDYLYQTDEKGNVLGDGELDFKKDYNEYRATTKKGRDFGLFKTTGRDFTDLNIPFTDIGGMNDMGTDEMSGLKIKKDYFPMYEIGTSKIPSEQELAFDATLAKEPFVRERLVPLPQLKNFKYQNKELPTQNRINVENVLTDQGVLPPRTSLSEIPLSGKEYTYDLLKDLTDDYNRTQKSKEARMYPAFGGSQFSEGGITTLRSKYEYKK